jgi:acylphosphatase
MTGDEVIRHVIVRGRVQGVGFRAFVEYQARERNLSGWVRNRRDGSVEAVFAGAEKSVEEMIVACHRGPASANVASVEARDGQPNDLEISRDNGFVCLPTV